LVEEDLMSFDLRYLVCPIKRLAFSLLIVTCLAACASRPEIIADPPQYTHTHPEIVPWEEEYAQMRPNPEIFEEEESSGDGVPFNGELEGRPEDKSGALQVLADVIAFPFRGVGWLLRQVF
jgi:hypothetical protein